jgi:hypothetical protein
MRPSEVLKRKVVSLQNFLFGLPTGAVSDARSLLSRIRVGRLLLKGWGLPLATEGLVFDTRFWRVGL